MFQIKVNKKGEWKLVNGRRRKKRKKLARCQEEGKRTKAIKWIKKENIVHPEINKTVKKRLVNTRKKKKICPWSLEESENRVVRKTKD